jgi:group I intron endonuclease
METYRATNTINGKFYIGSALDFERRKKEHLTSKKNLPFQNALRNNPESFEWEVTKDDTKDPTLEQALLDMYFGTGQCYNLNPKADRPPSHSGKKWWFSTLTGDECYTKECPGPNWEAGHPSQTKRQTGRGNQSFETKYWSNLMTGEVRRSESSPGPGWEIGRTNQSGQKHPQSKRVEITYPDGTVTVFSHAKEASETLNCNYGTLKEWARKSHTPRWGRCGGLTFKYLD